MSKPWNLKKINTLLLDGFDREALKRLFRFNVELEKLYHQLPITGNYRNYVFNAVEVVNAHGLLDVLLAAVKEANPHQYQIHYPYDSPLTHRRDYPLDRPRRAKHFTGRTKELNKLLNALQPGRVVTLCGPGGIGKSALAAEAIWQLAPNNAPPDRFPDGIFVHSFYNQSHIGQAMEALLRAFGIDPRSGPVEHLATQLLKNKQALLVLEGTEQADTLRSLLEIQGHCGILITSRNSEDAPDDFETIPPLPTTDAISLLKKWAKHRITDDTTAKHICNLVGGLPLAVRLVGRYLSQRGQLDTEYLEWLQSTPLAALDQGQRRDESIPYLLEQSLAQVSEPARNALATIGCLALAPFSPEPIAAAMEYEIIPMRHLLGELLSYGLLTRPGKHYQVTHALIHTYASRRMSVTEAALQRLGEYYFTLARDESKQGLAGYKHLDSHRPHLLHIIEECFKREAWGLVRKLIWAIQAYLEIQGHTLELVKVLEMGVKAAHQMNNRGDEGIQLGNLGAAYVILGQEEKAIELYQQALSIAQEIGNRHSQGVDLGNLGIAYRNLGQMEKAIEYYEEALSIAQEVGDRQDEGVWLGYLGVAYADLGQVEKAIEYYEQALSIAQEVGDRRDEGAWFGNLGAAYANLGQVEKAIEYYEQSLSIVQEIGDRRGEGTWLGNLGVAYADLGQVEKAIEYYEQSLFISQETGDRRNEGTWLSNLGGVYADLGQMKKAIEYNEQALTIAQEIGDRRVEGNRLRCLGVAYANLGRMKKAIEHYGQALTIAQEIGDRCGEGTDLGNLGLAYLALGQEEKAIEHYEQALFITQEIGDRRSENTYLGNLGNAYVALRQMKKAIEHYEQALSITRYIGDRHNEIAWLGNLGLAYVALGQVKEAIEYYQQALSIAQEIGNRHSQEKNLGNLGVAYANLGQVEKAIKHYERALSIAQEIGDRHNEGIWLGNLGVAYEKLGQLEKAKQYFEQSLTIFEAIKSPLVEKTRHLLDDLEREDGED